MGLPLMVVFLSPLESGVVTQHSYDSYDMTCRAPSPYSECVYIAGLYCPQYIIIIITTCLLSVCFFSFLWIPSFGLPCFSKVSA